MKILFVATDPLEPTGYAKISSHISNFLADQPNVVLYHLAIDYNHHQSNVTNRKRNPKIKYINSKIDNNSDIYGPPLINKLLRRIEPDLLIIYNDCIVTYRNLLELDKIPAIRRRLRVILYLDIIHEKMHRGMLEGITDRADDIYVFSDCWTQYIKTSKVLYHWIDPVFTNQDQTESRRRLNINKGDFVIVNTNRNSVHKRLDITVRAFLKFYKQVERKDEIKLLLVSTLKAPLGFDLLDLIQRECEYEDLEKEHHSIINNNILHLSKISDEKMNLVYNAGDVGINTTEIEGFGLCNLEMGSLGKPQIVSGVGGLRDIYPSFIEPKIRLYCSEVESAGIFGYKHICLAEDFTKELLKYYHDRELMLKDGENLALLLKKKYNKKRILNAWWKDLR